MKFPNENEQIVILCCIFPNAMCKFSFLVAAVVISKHPTNSMSTKPLSFRRMSRQHQRHHPQHHHLPPHQQPQQQMPQQQQQLTAQQQQQQQLLMAEHAAAAEAAELFDLLCVATTMRQILALHRAMCEAVGLRPSPLNDFYPRLKAKVRSWKAQALWKKFDARAAHRVYGKGAACTGTRVLVIGAGPCGLRTAIEAQLLGAKVVVLEKRDRITRNNVLHLWPFVITDLRNLGAKKFYGKFCAGSIDHISIRQLQCMLLKVALLLGVEIHEGVSFEHAVEPSGDGGGWRAAVTPSDHAVSHYEFDVLIGADGKRNMLDFRRKEFRGKLAIAITANFINKKTEAEAKVEEISGVAFIFNQAFFKELYGKTGIDLENIVYYKDETHYFVMTAKKHSLIDKGVIIEDMADPGELLAPANVDTQKLHDYAREAAEFSTQYQMPNLEFAVNHYGKPDVAMFDFTSMFAAEMSCRVIVRKGARLMQCLVGDSLLEPFWPTGSGCARGFLSSMDAAYAIKLWSNPQNSTLGVLAQRESIYRLLNQTTPDTLQRDISAYTVDPATRYPNLNRESVNSWQVKHLVDTDDPSVLEQTFMDTHTLQTPHLDTPGRRKRRSGDLLPQGATLLRWISAQLHAYQFIPELKEASDVFRNGRVLCALINRYRPDLIDYAATKDMNPVECNELAFAVLERELHIDRVMSAKQSLDLTELESRIWLNYLDQICDLFRGEIPHIKHPKMDFSDLRQKYRINHTHAQPDFSKLLATKPKAKSPMQDAVDIPTTVQRRSVLEEERAKRQRRHEQLLNIGGGAAGSAAGVAGSGTGTTTQGQSDTPRRSKKRRQVDKTVNIEERQQRLQEIEENRQERMSKRRQQRYHQTQNFYKSLQLLQAGKLLREGGEAGVAEDGTPFEDYSIFLYRQQAPVFNDRVKDLERKLLFPDRERGDIPSALPRTADEQFSDRIKNMEQRMTGRGGLGGDKKPKDLMRAIVLYLLERLECALCDVELGLPKRSSRKLVKTKSLGEGDFDMNPSKERLTGVQNILKRFESMSSVTSQNSDEQAAFKLRRMESTTSNLSSLTRSRESLVSVSDSMSDLEKTMDYLRNEWRNEATNFLQKKRDKFYAKKEVKIKAKPDPLDHLPVQYRDSKLAKFFGLSARKSPEKRKSPIKKKKSPSKTPKVTKANNSLEELAKISSVRQTKKAQPKTLKPVEVKPLKPASPVPDDFEILDLLEKASEAKELERSKTKSPAVEAIMETPKEAVVEIPLPVEDIKNLPKTGCDKSSNSSRRGSQSSLVVSRRHSEISLNDKLNQEALAALNQLEKEREAEQVDELFQSMVEEMEQEPQPIAIAEPSEEDIDADSLCTTISKSPSAQPVTVVKRGSSEDQSIEKLFSHFSDEMLVNVEFDSNDELVGITPRATLVSRNTEDRDYLDKLESLERDEETFHPVVGDKFIQENVQDEVDGLHFPSRPQRRPKSSSSSSEPSLPVAPQRLKKKLSKLDPEDMPPSVQDLLHQVYQKNIQPEKAEIIPVEGKRTLRFPSMLAEEDVDEVDHSKEAIKKIDTAPEEIKVEKITEPEEVAQAIPSPRKPAISQSNSLKSENSSGSSLVEVPKIIAPLKSSSKENSSDWDMEKLPASPMPRRRLLQNQTPYKAPSVASKESSLEWDMEKLPNSPMLPRRNKMRAISPSTNPVQLLNNLPSDADDEAAQRRLIEDFEQERRQALIKRDENFEAIAAEQRRRDSLQSSSNSSSKRSLPPPTPPMTMASRRGTTQDTNRTQDTATRHEGTPPMFKKLDVDGSGTSMDSTACSTRRSSFAFIELQDNKPVIVPMPKKLKLPKPEPPRFVPEPVAIDEPVPEVFQGRAWPKTQLEGEVDLGDSDDEDEAEKLKKQLPEYARSDSPPSAAFKNRKWPDGKTVFDKRAESLEEEDIFEGLLSPRKRGSQRFKDKPRSQSPQPFKPLVNSSRKNSKSYSDLKKGPSMQSLSAQSSQDTDTLSTTTTVATARPASYVNYEDPMDASTQALLDRSKRLHNRKRDFVNERVVERNPYMRDVLRTTDRRDYDDVDEDLTSYRPRHYASSTLNRFPNTTTRKSNNYDYLSPSSDYLSRRSYIPSASASSSYYPSSTRSSHLSDLFRRRSPASGPGSGSALSGYGNKESCIGLASDRVGHLIESKCTWVRSTKVQTESESTSPDEVELNSATEISTDSEFDNDEIIRQAPKIFIDDTHLRKPTKVQIKSTMIGPNAASAGLHQKQLAAREKGGSYLQKYQPQPPLPQFKPLVQVDPTLLIGSQRAPLQNPRPGDYLLNKTASTEGIASKKSLELKKRYLLGEPANGNKIQKSGSTSVLDSRIRSFQSNISECQKLLNPSSDISAGMRTFLDRTKLGEGSQTTGQTNELIRSATSNVINDLRVELRIQKTGSSHSTDNEKENVFVNCKNELNKGMEYTDAVNATLLDQLARKSSPTTPTNKTVVEVIDLVTPERPMDIIDLTALETPKKQLVDGSAMDVDERLTPDSNKISELQQEVKEEPKPDVSRDVKECIPDILGHIKEGTGPKEPSGEDQQSLLEESDEEKRDSPEKDVAEHELYEPDSVQIQVPNIPWDKTKPEVMSTTGSSGSICSSSDSSSIEDIQHYILESTTSPDTQTVGGKHNVPRLEVHDTSGALMQVDSLMIVNGKYIGDPEDVKFLDMPANVIVPPAPALKTNELDMEDDQEVEAEPVTATPEPVECTVIETERRVGAPPPLPEMGPPKLKFDSKNENKIESLKNLPLIVESNVEHSQAVKPITLNLSNLARTPDTPTTPTAHDSDKTPTGEILSRGSDSETEHTGTGQVLTETELSDWTADDCISENFVDLEFVLNSNKGTIKRRKDRRRSGASKLPSGNEVIHELARQAPVVQMDGILSAIDIDDIEFMDTGSEGSCAEAYSATNTALIQNRGYMEYIEAEPKKATRKAAPPSSYPGNLPPLMTKRDEKLGIDYIEQGAYIMHDDAKTPVNEVAPAMTQSLTDSSTLNELDDDSMIISQTQPTTTEESEALTVVTSPLDTSSPRVLDQFASMLAAGKGDSTPSSSEQQPKTSTVTSSSTGPNSSTPGNVSKEPQEEDLQIQFEYVRALQQRISQISTQRRKSSKGEAPNLQLNSSAPVIESAEDPPKPAEEPVVLMRPRTTSISGKVPEIPTLSSKLEEITKERTKQKDLIHDLVMDKLQSKKQLNAEKRLHRSRQRSLLTSGYASGSSLSPTPKLAAACSPQDSNCSSQAHYHASTAKEGPKQQEERPLQKSATSTYVSPYRTVQAPTRSADLYKPRPFSEHIDSNALAGYKLGKTASFNGGKLDDFAKPIAPARVNRGGGVVTADVANISASTENLRSEARARARLKSNTELGLSPEEKMQLIRSRLHYDQNRSLKSKQLEEMPSGDLAARARKMSASKSVNDLAYMVGQQQQQQVETDTVLQAKAADFTSDPNLASGVQEKTGKTKSGRRPKDPERRKSLIQSLSSFFQKGSASAASSAKEQGGTVAAGHSEHSERPGTSSSGTPTISDAAGGGGGGGGVFSRFRISPKSKEKSKSCFDLRNFGFGDKDMLVCNAASPAGATSQKNHSQDYLNTTNNSRYRKQTNTAKPKPESFSSSSPQLYIHKPHHLAAAHPSALDDQTPPPIPPLPLNYQRSDDESYANETREHKKQRAISKASRQAELKRLRIAQEIQREQEEIEVQLKDLEARGVLIEKALRGEAQNIENLDATKDNDEKLLKELLEIWRNITALKKRDEELTIRQQELQLEYRHAQLKEELNLRLSCNKLDKSSADVAAEGAILNEMLEIVAKRAALRPTASQLDLTAAGSASTSAEATGIKLTGQPHDHEESII
ncbi:LOW QUALITY PROTEIN: uncharacterized protein Dyak_GE24713 [Drosophila yakuba]|uniref:F-actin monooxygenase n=1 Tax=Drosophila yakuba TaxID=7245 RepID=B4PVI1_DROYA|nr:LOW QUALITY PROTEIN: uncharacterized protein Dyak_GE24713 [Drosophila yakuba]